ncbi:MAG TPA: polysaccharide deacetylase family protein [Burkholderiales bacterium]|nr:polysaccharide deacetylase family protein [Burkholderiales bacterium]
MTTDRRDTAGSVQVRRWHPAPAIRVSGALHAMGALTLAIQPELWLWVVTVLAANHLVLISAVFSPRGCLLGPNLSRLPAAFAKHGEVVLTFDDGPDPEVTPQILDLLDRFRMKASFFCIGEKAAAFPEIVNEIARRGHSVENHTYRHSYAFAFYGISRLGRELDAAQSILRENAGRPPRFFRAPVGFRSPLLDPVLATRGLHYVSWTRRGYDTVYTDPRVTLDKLTRGLAAGDILLLHDGSSAQTPAGQAMVLAVLPPLLDKLESEGLKSVALPDCFSTQVKAEESALDASALS